MTAEKGFISTIINEKEIIEFIDMSTIHSDSYTTIKVRIF